MYLMRPHVRRVTTKITVNILNTLNSLLRTELKTDETETALFYIKINANCGKLLKNSSMLSSLVSSLVSSNENDISYQRMTRFFAQIKKNVEANYDLFQMATKHTN